MSVDESGDSAPEITPEQPLTPAQPNMVNDPPIAWLSVGGWSFFVVGLAAAGFSFFMETAVTNDSFSSLSATFNIGLLQHQLMVFQAGAAAAVVGAIFLVGSVLEKAVVSPAAERRVRSDRDKGYVSPQVGNFSDFP